MMVEWVRVLYWVRFSPSLAFLLREIADMIFVL